MKILKKSVLLLLSLALMTSFVSCDPEESVPDDSGILVEDMTGSWYVQFLVDGEDVYDLGYQQINTYNTAVNDGNGIWIDDNEHTWVFKVKTPVNLSDLTFAGTGLYSNVGGYEVDVNITNGKIVKDDAKTPSGDTVDSIYFEAEFSDDPGTIYQFVGFKSTAKVIDIP